MRITRRSFTAFGGKVAIALPFIAAASKGAPAIPAPVEQEMYVLAENEAWHIQNGVFEIITGGSGASRFLPATTKILRAGKSIYSIAEYDVHIP